MKWIGQHIYDLISRFRSDVYLEDVSTGTIASGGNLGLDSNNKIVKAVSASGDLTSIIAGTGLSGTDLTGPIPTLNVDAAQTGITSLGTLSSLQVDNINLNGKDITVSGDSSGDEYSLILDSNGAVVLATVDSDGEDGHIYIKPDGDLRVQTKTGQVFFGDLDNNHDYCLLTVGADGDTTIQTVDAAGTSADLTLNIDGKFLVNSSQMEIDSNGAISKATWSGGKIADTFLSDNTAHLDTDQTFTGTKTLNSFKGTAGATVTNILDEDAMGSDSATALATQQSIKAYADTKSLLAGSSSVTTLGTIGTGVWEGTAIASDQQKHLMHYQVQGYSAGSSNYVAAKVITDVRAPFLHSVDIGSDGLTAKTIQIWMRTGGHTMPNACTLKRFTGWTAAAGGASQTVALFRVRLEDDVDSDPSAVLLQEVTYTASGNATANLFNVTAASSGDASDLVLAAGDIIFSALKGAGNPTYFNGTFEVEF